MRKRGSEEASEELMNEDGMKRCNHTQVAGEDVTLTFTLMKRNGRKYLFSEGKVLNRYYREKGGKERMKW